MKQLRLRDITFITEDGREVRLADTVEVTLDRVGGQPVTIAQLESRGLPGLGAGFGVGLTLPPSAWAWAEYVVQGMIAAAEAKTRAAAEEDNCDQNEA